MELLIFIQHKPNKMSPISLNKHAFLFCFNFNFCNIRFINAKRKWLIVTLFIHLDIQILKSMGSLVNKRS